MQKPHLITVAAVLVGTPLLAQEVTATLRLHATPNPVKQQQDQGTS